MGGQVLCPPFCKSGTMKRLILFLCALLTLTACGAPSSEKEVPSADAVTFVDDLGREVTVSQDPERVAALIGSFADVWCIAGGKDSLVAAAGDAWTSFDLDLDESVADLGAIKEPNLEVLFASQPELVLASCNTQADLELRETLEKADIAVAYFDVQHFEDYIRMLQICTQLTGRPDRYAEYGTDLSDWVYASISRQDDSDPTVLCIRATGTGCKVKGSRDNLLGEMLSDLGCVNIADGDSALLEDLSVEAIIDADPDYIFAVLQGADATKARASLENALLRDPAWNSLRAVKEGRFYTLDHALYNLKPNANWGVAYENLADILYPDA